MWWSCCWYYLCSLRWPPEKCQIIQVACHTQSFSCGSRGTRLGGNRVGAFKAHGYVFGNFTMMNGLFSVRQPRSSSSIETFTLHTTPNTNALPDVDIVGYCKIPISKSLQCCELHRIPPPMAINHTHRANFIASWQSCWHDVLWVIKRDGMGIDKRLWVLY